MKLKIDTKIVWDSDAPENIEEVELAPIWQDMKSGSITPTTFVERETFSLTHDVIRPVLDRLKSVSKASSIIVKAEREIKANEAEIKGAMGVAKASHDALLAPMAKIKNTEPLELNDKRLQSLYSAVRDFLGSGIAQDKIVFFKDTYNHDTWQSEVVRLGINISASAVKKSLTAYNSNIITPLNNEILKFNRDMTSTQADTQS